MPNFHPPIQMGHSLVQTGHSLIGHHKSHLLILCLYRNQALNTLNSKINFNVCTYSNSLLTTVGHKSV